MPKISVIVPVYKVEKYLERCVESILNQTYRNLEVILVDDGSPDGCGAICDAYAQKDNRVRVIHKQNGGLSSARNAGMEIASGEYITFVDGDDWIDTDMYEKLLAIALDTSADIVECNWRFYRPWKTENKILEKECTDEITVYTNVEALDRLYFGPQTFSDIGIMVWNKLYRAELVSNLRFLEGCIYEDTEYTPRALYNSKKVVKYDHTFYNYNIHLGSDSTSGMRASMMTVNSGICVKKKTADFFLQHPVSKVTEYAQNAYLGALQHGYYTCWRMGGGGLTGKKRRRKYGRKLRRIGAGFPMTNGGNCL